MKSIAKKFSKRAAFTIVELLTVMSIIVILIGLLVPGLNMAKRFAKKVMQNNQFHAISIAMEQFNAEEDGYPDSKVLPGPSAPSCTTGAHHLAEALVGRDLQGLDPFSTWNAQNDVAQNIYGRGNPAEIDASLDRRKGPYLKLDRVGAFQIFELYGNTPQVYDGSAASAPVLTDVYRVKRVTLPNKEVVKAGTPILYYKADISSKIFDFADPANSIFNSQDNEDLIALPPMMDPTQQHHLNPGFTHADGRQGRQIFYDEIRNPQIRNQARPYNKDSYILISAGFDGLYGTRDDILNFGH